MTVYIKVEHKNGKISILEVQESEVEKCVRMLWSMDTGAYNHVVNVTVIRKGLQ